MALDVESGILLRLRFEADLRLEYKGQTQVVQEIIEKGMMLGRNEQKWGTRIAQRVLRVEEDGSAHMLTTSEPDAAAAEIQVPGVQIQRQVMYAQLDPRGNMLEVSGGGSSSTYSFPDGPVRPGEAWEAQTVVHFPGMPAPATATNRFVLGAAETVNGFECVRIEMSSSEVSFEMMLPDGQQKARVLLENQGTLFFAPAEGILVRMELRTKSIPKIQDFTFDTTTTVTQDLERWESPSRQA